MIMIVVIVLYSYFGYQIKVYVFANAYFIELGAFSTFSTLAQSVPDLKINEIAETLNLKLQP